MNLKTAIIAVLLCGGTFVAAGCTTTGHERTAGAVIDDATVTTKVRTALLAEKDLNSFDISIKTFDGTVQLSGFVDSQWQIDKAVQVASAINGVQTVKNDLIHKPKQ